MAIKAKGVRTRHAQYDIYAAKWKRCRDVMAGQDAVHAAGIYYLPKLKEQTQEDYEAYKKRATFYNASWRTVAGLCGMMFRKPPTKDIPPGIEPLLEDVTLSGVPFDRFSQDASYEVLQIGRVGLLVDHPPMPLDGAAITVAVKESFGLRPTIKSYPAESIINWKYKTINNRHTLAMVVLEEEHEEKGESEFEIKCEKRYRVLDLQDDRFYRVRVFRINDNQQDEQVGQDIIPFMNGEVMSFIPFVFIGPDGTEATLEEPPLIDLVDVNLSHYRSTADYEHGCHFTGLPTPYITGYSVQVDAEGKPVNLYIGAQSAWLIQNSEAKVGFLEFTGTGLTTLRENLDAKKQEMATLGARALADGSAKQVETFGATAIKHVAENSILASIAISTSKGLTIALQWFSDWTGIKAEIEYDINRDFLPVQMDAPTLTAWVSAWQQGALSEAELFDNFQKADVIRADKTLEEHQEEIDTAPPPAPPSSARPGALGTLDDDEEIERKRKEAEAIPPKKQAT